jgi:uncharacterized protein YbjT (DUF2867 family)
MKVFVTGATSVVGTRAVPTLVEAGHEVTAVARSDAKADLVRSLGARALMKSLRVSNRRFKEASGWAPAHPSIRGSWSA